MGNVRSGPTADSKQKPPLSRGQAEGMALRSVVGEELVEGLVDHHTP